MAKKKGVAIMGYLITAFLSYLVGSSNLAFYIAKWRQKDLRGAGSGNYGASNATILLGWKAGIAVAVHDIGKAAIAMLVCGALFPALPYVREVAGVACVLGHIFPFYLRFRGGKGFASYLGMTLMLNWKLGLCVIAAVILVTLITDYIVAGTLTTIVSVPVAQGYMTRSLIPAVILLVATAVILYKHKENYVRIYKRQEIGLRSTLRGEHRIKS